MFQRFDANDSKSIDLDEFLGFFTVEAEVDDEAQSYRLPSLVSVTRCCSLSRLIVATCVLK